jgi:toxin HigB-1
MRIRSVAHKGLRALIEDCDPSGVPSAVVTKLVRMLSFLQEMADVEELRALPHWNAHRLEGRRRDTWSLTVTRNWRLTFQIDDEALEIIDLDYEDYH